MNRLIKESAFAVVLVAALAGCATQAPLSPPASTSATSAKPATISAVTPPLAPTANASPQASTTPAPTTQAPPIQVESSSASNEPLKPILAAHASGQLVAPLAAPADLWERIRRGYSMSNLEGDLVKDREQYYASRPDYIFRMTERSRKYLFHIVEDLERRNMPSELALLPFIESAFNPQAISSAKAAGMWQFMPATGKHFELKQNAFRDDRRDVLASTRAALDYLQKLHGRFGDWHLALAAYNWGEGSVGRAIAKNKGAGLGTGYLDLSMPAETRLYVPKLQAMKNIVNAPEFYKSSLPLIENHPFFQTVSIVRDIDVALAARLAEVNLDDFKALNPSASRPVLLAAGTPQILLPWDQAVVFEQNLKSHRGGRLASWTVWIAPQDMKTAEAAKKTGMSEEDLRTVNHIPPRSIVKAGSSLVVTRSNRVERDVTVEVADHGQLGIAPEILTRRTLLKAGKSESVATVAKKYHLPPGSVAEWNKVKSSASFAKGQQVVLFLPTQMAKASTRAHVASSAKKAKPAGSKPTRLAKR